MTNIFSIFIPYIDVTLRREVVFVEWWEGFRSSRRISVDRVETKK